MEKKLSLIHILRTLGVRFVPDLAARYLAANPGKDIRFTFHTGVTSHLLQGLAERQYDLAFASQPAPELGFTAIPVDRQDLVPVSYTHLPSPSPTASWCLPWAITSPIPKMCIRDRHRSYEQQYKEQLCFRMCELFGVDQINGGLMETYSVEYTAQKLKELCHRAGKYTIGVEPMPYSGLPDVKKAWAVVKASGCDNAKLILDSWHWVRAGQSYDPQVLAEVPAEKIVSVQINDVQAHPYAKSILRDESMHDRMLPGTCLLYTSWRTAATMSPAWWRSSPPSAWAASSPSRWRAPSRTGWAAGSPGSSAAASTPSSSWASPSPPTCMWAMCWQ